MQPVTVSCSFCTTILKRPNLKRPEYILAPSAKPYPAPKSDRARKQSKPNRIERSGLHKFCWAWAWAWPPVSSRANRYLDYFVTMLPFIKHKLTHRFLLATFRLLIYFSLVESMAGQCQRKKKKLIVRPEKIVQLYKICLAKSKHAMAMQATRTTSEQNQLAWLRLSI
jgi:hypothetical protein